MDSTRYEMLLRGWLNRQLTAEELREFFTLSEEAGHVTIWADSLERDLHARKYTGASNALQAERVFGNVTAVQRVPVYRLSWIKYAAAIIVLFGIGAYLWNTASKEKPSVVQTIPVESDIFPGGQKAMLTLADGSIIVLDSAANGQLAAQPGSIVSKKDGQILYDAGQQMGEGVSYNTLSTPRGGQYQLSLSDGTRVWLNAASSITYPTIFNGEERHVKITGEVYFEVAKNKSKPFIVKTGRDEITVLGTSFNVNSYPDEPFIKTSLIEGAVSVSSVKQEGGVTLQPGQAAINGKIIKTNTDQDVSWKNGVFNFQDLKVEAAMRQLSRWYDIDIKYDGKIPDEEFGGKIGRNLNLSQVIKILDGVVVKLHLEGNVLHVKPL